MIINTQELYKLLVTYIFANSSGSVLSIYVVNKLSNGKPKGGSLLGYNLEVDWIGEPGRSLYSADQRFECTKKAYSRWVPTCDNVP
jgi:hypothetical protein